MQIPALERLRDASSVLLLGAGGGYDILGAVPLLVAFHAAGKRVTLGGITFSSFGALSADPLHPCLVPVTGDAAVVDRYCPEAWLARWMSERGLGESVWAIAKTGVRPLRAALAQLVESVGADALVLVDGGIDILLRGDETSIGTPSEDLAMLCAVHGLPVAERLVMCVGFGAELRDGISHAQALERIASLARENAFLGAVSLTPLSPEGAAYLEALHFVQAGQSAQRRSHVQSTVANAMTGGFGGPEPDQWVSPLSALCWFFSLPEVAKAHLFLDTLENAESIFDVTAIIRGCRKNLDIRPRTSIPL